MTRVFCSRKLPQPLLTNIPLSSSRKMDSRRTTVACPQPGRSSLFGISTICFYLQPISGHLRTQGIKQIPKLYLPHFTLSGCSSQYLPSCSCSLIYALTHGSSNPFHHFGSTLLLHIPFPILLFFPPSVSPSSSILLLRTSPTQAPHSPVPILALQSCCLHRSAFRSSSSYVASPPARKVSTGTCLDHTSYFQALPHALLLFKADHHHW